MIWDEWFVFHTDVHVWRNFEMRSEQKTRINKGFWGVILLVIGLVVKRNILYDLWLWSVWDGLSNAVLYDNIGA